VLATSVRAHVPGLSGKLVAVARRSDVIVIARIEQVRDTGPRRIETTGRVERLLAGDLKDKTVTYGGGPRLAPGRRYVVFLRRGDAGFACTQEAGTVFPVSPNDDERYAQTIAGVRAATAGDEGTQVHALRMALIPALRASAGALRFQAALELAALAHHGELAPDERRELERIAVDPATDATVRRLVAKWLARRGTRP
jgi:hypothetical protein